MLDIPKGRVFAHTTVAPHSGIGYHIHNGDTEIYYILSGKAKYNDNGTIVDIEAGDVTFTPSGTGHGIENDNDEPLDIIALIEDRIFSIQSVISRLFFCTARFRMLKLFQEKNYTLNCTWVAEVLWQGLRFMR